MSDAPLFAPPVPQTALDMGGIGAALDAHRTPLGAYLGASMGEGFWATAAGQSRAQGRLMSADQNAAPAERELLDQAAWQASEHHREGLSYRPGLTVARARVLAEIHDENQNRQQLMAQRRPSTGDQVLGFGAGVLGALPTPENFLPFAQPALRAAQAGRFGGFLASGAARVEAAQAGGWAARLGAGAATGAVDATLGSLAVMPSTLPSRASFGDEVTWAEVFQDLAFGAAAGAVLGGAAGAAFGAPGAAHPSHVPPTMDPRPGQAPPPIPQQDATLHGLATGMDQLASGAEVDLAMAAPSVRAALEAAHAENARLSAMVLHTGGTGLADQVAGRPLVVTGTAAPGAEGRATTPDGRAIGFRYEVVDAGDLVTSHTQDFAENPAFPQELQPRARDRAEAQAWVAETATRLRPEDLEANPSTTSGAPIVGEDGLVESGNGRTLAIRRAYAEGLPTAQTYRAMLARLGFDVQGMAEPVLIRRRTTPLDAEARRAFTAESNVDQLARMSAGEQARTDARRLTPELLARLQPGGLDSAANADFIRAVIEALPQSERTALSSGGKLTADGLTRLERALAARAYGDGPLVTRLAESRDGAAENMGRALLNAAPALARLRGLVDAGQVRGQLDAIPALVRAVQRISAARAAGQELRSVFDQLHLFGDGPGPAERAWLDLLLRHPVRQEIGGVGRDVLTARIEAYAKAASEAPSTPDVFGGPPPGLGDVMRLAFREAGIETPATLRGLDADTWAPPEALDPEPLQLQHASGDPVAAAAERMGLDLGGPEIELEAARLRDAGQLDAESLALLDEADATAAKVEHAEETWGAAAACVVRG
ncbi:hypothetical protein UFOVP99_17 [uncultured Caudovirales phage]|uniref:DdrB-like domain-containing protein n=1 Tax=uncultured Caudovirales phage TaxID=2100421 RepID=A0A6J5L4I6_9CAUD|nr:hypothetical protein UFOVP99_17 [uncultured Caudovirales phage]